MCQEKINFISSWHTGSTGRVGATFSTLASRPRRGHHERKVQRKVLAEPGNPPSCGGSAVEPEDFRRTSGQAGLRASSVDEARPSERRRFRRPERPGRLNNTSTSVPRLCGRLRYLTLVSFFVIRKETRV